MTIRVAVGDVMTRNFASVSPDTDLSKCAKEMVKQRVDSLIVSHDERLLGILTARDILWAMIKKPGLNLSEVKVSDVATRKVAVIKPSADIGQALHKMKQYGFRRLPVLSRGKLVGLLTLKDILRVNPSLYTELGHLGEIKEEARKLKKLKRSRDEIVEGLCEECGALSDLLKIDGRYLCPDCREELY